MALRAKDDLDMVIDIIRSGDDSMEARKKLSKEIEERAKKKAVQSLRGILDTVYVNDVQSFRRDVTKAVTLKGVSETSSVERVMFMRILFNRLSES